MRVEVVEEERYWYPDDGGIVWLAGLTAVDADGRYLGRDALEARGLLSCGAAGARQHHGEVLDAVAPGSGLTVRRDAANPHDPNAIALDAPEGQLGWVPRELAARLAPRIDGGEAWHAVVLREQRASPRDPRTGVTVLLAPEPIELHVRPAGRRRP